MLVLVLVSSLSTPSDNLPSLGPNEVVTPSFMSHVSHHSVRQRQASDCRPRPGSSECPGVEHFARCDQIVQAVHELRNARDMVPPSKARDIDIAGAEIGQLCPEQELP
jgi:hypothetical protein